MKESHLIAYVFWLLTCALINADYIGTFFEANESFDGKSCNDADFVFRKEFPRSKIDCLIECVNHVDCVSVFHVQQTGNCTGCGVSYGIVDNPTELMDGSKYYEEQRCPTGWTVIANSCYYITPVAKTFEDGVTECQSANAHPVIMNDESENNNIKAFINSMTFTNGEYAFYTAFKSTTVGEWLSHGSTESLSFDDWLPSEPSYDDAAENCLVYFLVMNLQWIDSPCSEKLRMVCEKEI